MFTRDAELLVIGPIEHMVKMVKSLGDNPLGGMRVNNGGTALSRCILHVCGPVLLLLCMRAPSSRR